MLIHKSTQKSTHSKLPVCLFLFFFLSSFFFQPLSLFLLTQSAGLKLCTSTHIHTHIQVHTPIQTSMTWILYMLSKEDHSSSPPRTHFLLSSSSCFLFRSSSSFLFLSLSISSWSLRSRAASSSRRRRSRSYTNLLFTVAMYDITISSPALL